MRFALLGIDAESWQLVSAVCTSTEHDVVTVCHVDAANEQQLRAIAPISNRHEDWESLLADDDFDAVIVALPKTSGENCDALRKLVQAATPLIVVHPAGDPLFCYELDMIQRDVGGIIFPFFSRRMHPAIERLQNWFQAGNQSPIGELEQINLERGMQDRSRHAVLLEFSRDIELIAAISGKIQRVSAIGPSPNSSDFGSLSVQACCANDTVARWSVYSVSGESPGSLTLVGTAGKATLRMATNTAWQLEVNGEQAEVFADVDEGRAGLEAFSHAISGKPTQFDWPEACRGVEITDTIHRCLRRGRTIEILDEQHSEEQSFKGIMAAGGCAVLMVVLVVFLVMAVVDGLMMPHRDTELRPISASEAQRHPIAPDPRNPNRAHLLVRIWPVYPIAIFLFLQFLRLIIKKDDPTKTGNGVSKPTSRKVTSIFW